MQWCDVLFGLVGATVPGKPVARPVNLAQASQSRLGEMNRELAQDFCAKGRPGDQLSFLSEQASRPGKRGLA